MEIFPFVYTMLFDIFRNGLVVVADFIYKSTKNGLKKQTLSVEKRLGKILY